MNQTLTNLFWKTLPARAHFFSRSAFYALSDGFYLCAGPSIAGWLSLGAFISGVTFGWTHFLFSTVFTESRALLMFLIFLAVSSANLGLLFTLGFAIGDLFLNPDQIPSPLTASNWVDFYLPHLLEYTLISLMTVQVPLVTKGLLSRFTFAARLNQTKRRTAAIGGHLFLTLALVYFWSQGLPLLIRPLYTWPHGEPGSEAMWPLQEEFYWLLAVAALASITRVYLQCRLAEQPEEVSKITPYETHYREMELKSRRASKPYLWFTVVFLSLWSTLLIAGMMSAWFDALFALAIILLIRAAREKLISLPLGKWPKIAAKIPLVLKILLGFGIVYAVSWLVVRTQMNAGLQSLRGILMMTLFAMVVVYLLHPIMKSRETPAE